MGGHYTCNVEIEGSTPSGSTMAKYEFVDHPGHYNEHPSGVECIDVIEYMTWNIGTAIKHLWRAGLKPGATTEQDLQKAIWYINRELKRIKRDG